MFLFGLLPVKYMKVENLSTATDANSSKKLALYWTLLILLEFTTPSFILSSQDNRPWNWS